MSETNNSELEKIIEIVHSYKKEYNTFYNVARSYVGDLFSYSQIQLSAIDAYKENTFIGGFEMDYSNVDWSDFHEFGSDAWFINIKSLTTSYPGIDKTTGRMYCIETHVTSSRAEADTYIEYYCNSENEAGVTTLNWKKNAEGVPNLFEYHFCDFGSKFVIQAYFNIVDGEFSLTRINAQYPGNRIDQNLMTEDDQEAIISYILSEVERIPQAAADLTSANEKAAADAGITVPEEMQSVPVSYDKEILRKMLGK